MEFLIFLGSGVFLLGLACVVWMVVTKRRAQGIANWPDVEGQIVRAQVSLLERETAEGVVRAYTPLLAYTYAVAGQSYTSRRLNFVPAGSATYADGKLAQASIEPYPAGARAKVYYNPANPMQSALQKPRPTAHNAVILYGVVAMIAGAGIIALGIVL